MWTSGLRWRWLGTERSAAGTTSLSANLADEKQQDEVRLRGGGQMSGVRWWGRVQVNLELRGGRAGGQASRRACTGTRGALLHATRSAAAGERHGPPAGQGPRLDARITVFRPSPIRGWRVRLREREEEMASTCRRTDGRVRRSVGCGFV